MRTIEHEQVDWALRASRGGDGAPPPKPVTKHAPPTGTTSNMTAVLEPAEVATLSNQSILVVLDFGAGWCKNCAKLAPACEALSTKLPSVAFATVDIDDAEELVEEYAAWFLPYPDTPGFLPYPDTPGAYVYPVLHTTITPPPWQV